MKNCENCGMPVDDETEYCPECGEQNHCDISETADSLMDEFNVLYDITEFDDLEEGKFEAMRKRRIFLNSFVAIITVVIVAFVGVKLFMNKAVTYDEVYTEDSNIKRETSEHKEDAESEAPSDEEVFVDDEKADDSGEEIAAENNIDAIKHEVKRVCSSYNNGRTPYDGELIGVVNDSTTITATYIIPNAISAEEKERVAETEEEIRKLFSDELSGKFSEEINVIVNIKVSYRD